MARLPWDRGALEGHRRSEFDPSDYEEVLQRLAAVCGVPLQFQPERDRRGSGLPYFPVRVGGRRSGWSVTSTEASAAGIRAATTAAEVIGRVFTAEEDMASLAMELADRYEELNFLYEMGARVGGLLDEEEICDFVVNEAAWLLNSERASIMLADPVTRELRICAAVGVPEEIAGDVAVRPGEGISGKVFESGHGIIHNEGEPMPADSLNVRELHDSHCFLSVPLKTSSEPGGEEHVLGVFNLTRKRQGSMFTASDQKLVSAVAATTATQIHNCRLINAERERRQLEHELELAARIQLSLLPEEALRAGSLQLGGYCKPARHVGGDLFDYWVQDDRVCLVVADVSGHDMGAALMAAAFRSVLRSEAAHRHSVAGLMAQVNRALFEDLAHSELLISCFYAEIDLPSGMVSFCRAGHPLPLLIQNGKQEWLDTEGLLIGVAEDGEFGEGSVQLDCGDTVILYTDGLMEVWDGQGRPFGSEGVRKAALETLGSAPTEAAVRIVAAAREHAGGAPLADDVTVLVVRFEDESEK